MASKQTYPIRNYTIGQYLLTLRSRAQLTQAALADRVGVHRRSVQKWESGETYPTVDNLRTLIAVLLPLNAFTPGQEHAEAVDLWQKVSESAPQPLPFFDTVWFNRLLIDPHSHPPDREPISTHTVSFPPPPDQSRGPRARQITPALPFISTPLIGRSNDLTRIAQILDNPACRLLTLIGPGGIGKTRLALEVAARQAGTFSDTVAFVALASVGSPDQIVSAIGDALNFSFAGPFDLFTYLRERPMLLLLDDFEHLLDGSNLIVEMLQAAPHLTILVTSRARLNIQAEWLFDVEGLSYPPVDAFGWSVWHDASNLTDYGAVQLFIQRAIQIQPDLPLTEATLMTIIRICQHVAGIPLAIELAAAGVRLLPVDKIEQQLRSNLDTLATTLRDVPLRHRSMRAVFDHSWDLLSESEQAVFSRLSVFRGGWNQAAVEGICAEVTGHSREKHKGDHTLPFLSHTVSPALLASLIDKSLVHRKNGKKQSFGDADPANASGGPHFVLLEPIREYALEQLTTRGEVDRLQHAHANYYLALAEAVETLKDSPTPSATHDQINREYDNLYAALQWAYNSGQYLLGLKLAGALWRFWRRRGYISEGRVWLEKLLSLVDNTSSNPRVIDARLNALNGAAWLASYQHDFAHAAQIFEQSMALRRDLGDVKGETSLLDNTARAWRSAGQYRRAIPLMEEALAQHRAHGNRGSLGAGGLGFSLYELGLVLRELGDFARAADLFEECVAFHQALGDREGRAIALLGLSDIARDQGDIAQAR
ncbi:MAG: tetratricopeptide repeat protein, partial [Anaerolineae bacterium]|nr:tetratricopeptide repeat protein [Anaerolineae bacterium]